MLNCNIKLMQVLVEKHSVEDAFCQDFKDDMN